MKKIFAFVLLSLSFSCTTPVSHLFGHKTPHDQYADRLTDSGLDDTPSGRTWIAASKMALETPQPVQLPNRLQGYFHPDRPRALGLQFTAREGEQLSFTIDKNESYSLTLYTDLYQQVNGNVTHLLSADTSGKEFRFTIPETGSYLLRLQPPLNQTGGYALSISIRPSLHFPVGGGKAQAGSFWGDDRDGGKRHHEGIDIFAPKLTPAVAAADGEVVSVREGGLGGKTVWLRPDGKNVTLYYAHLDKQLVQEGQVVKQGDTVGLVGNTGNAVHTPSHLHFGVYGAGGAVDPFPFIDQKVRTAPAFASKNLTTYLRLVKAQKAADGRVIGINTLLVPLAATATYYMAELPDGRVIQTPLGAVQITKEIIKPVPSPALTVQR